MAVNVEKYTKKFQEYVDMAKAARNGGNAAGGIDARESKAQLRQECREMERESNRDGQIMTATVNRSGRVSVEVKEADSKRDLQGEYLRKFNNEAPVRVGGQDQTLRQYHKKRLGR